MPIGEEMDVRRGIARNVPGAILLHGINSSPLPVAEQAPSDYMRLNFRSAFEDIEYS